MAKIVIEMEDQADGGLSLRFTGDDVKTARTMATNTPAQNAAIFVSQQLREVGMNAPDLSGAAAQDGAASAVYLDEAKYLIQRGKEFCLVKDNAAEDTHTTLYIPPSGEPKSLFSNLTLEQRQALAEWADAQPRGNGGSVDLGGWPGWAEVLMSGLEKLKSETNTAIAQDEYHKTSVSGMKFDIRSAKFVE